MLEVTDIMSKVTVMVLGMMDASSENITHFRKIKKKLQNVY
jgi:hypothetical protein